jgi:hypothetical protein
MDWPPPAEQIPSLPLEMLAMSLLKRIAKEGSSRGLHRNTIVGINGWLTSMGSDYGHPTVLEAVNEAWHQRRLEDAGWRHGEFSRHFEKR